MNWAGQPLTSHEVAVNLIARTTTRTGLTVRAERDTSTCPRGIKITDREMKTLTAQYLTPHDWHGEWNLCVTGHRFHYAGAGIMGRGTADLGNAAEFERVRTA